MVKIKCLKCNDILTSVHQHDFQQCKCGACFVDGGGSPYIRIGGDPKYIMEYDEEGNEKGIMSNLLKERESKNESND